MAGWANHLARTFHVNKDPEAIPGGFHVAITTPDGRRVHVVAVTLEDVKTKRRAAWRVFHELAHLVDAPDSPQARRLSDTSEWRDLLAEVKPRLATLSARRASPRELFAELLAYAWEAAVARRRNERPLFTIPERIAQYFQRPTSNHQSLI
ncbi:hypothetical protein JCM19992_16090 [Thermostilla marina]